MKGSQTGHESALSLGISTISTMCYGLGGNDQLENLVHLRNDHLASPLRLELRACIELTLFELVVSVVV
jgi:hypothetical protein